jgi:DedD protein
VTPANRNRLVGSIILVTAAIIIIPSVLDGRKKSYKDNFKAVPDRPEFRSVQTAKTFPKNEFEQYLPKTDETIVDEVALDATDEAPKSQVETTSEASEKEVLSTETIAVNTISKPVDFDAPPEKAKPKAKPKAKQETQKQAIPVKTSPFTSSAWVIQLGSFGLKANALALEKKLNDAGFATFNRQINTNSGNLIKVYVGPELDKKLLDIALTKVNKVANVKGIITTLKIKR